MLNPFPLQFLSLFAYFILRTIIGFVFLILSYRHFKQRKSLYTTLAVRLFPFGKVTTILLILTELIIGGLFVLGLYTQIAALLTIIMSAKMLFFRIIYTNKKIFKLKFAKIEPQNFWEHF